MDETRLEDVLIDALAKGGRDAGPARGGPEGGDSSAHASTQASIEHSKIQRVIASLGSD
jgi:hypothetical protein